MEEMTNEEFSLQLQVHDEWFKCVNDGNRAVEKFMNVDNGKNLKLKLKVLKALNAGKQPKEIEDYDKVVKIPKGIWD